MTNRIASDNFSAHGIAKERKSDGRGDTSQPKTKSVSTEPAAKAEVTRGAQVLTQATASRPADSIISPEQAQQRLAELREQLNSDPRRGMDAHGQVNTTLFEAAMARYTA